MTNKQIAVYTVIGIILLVIGFGYSAVLHDTEQERTITINEKWTKYKNEDQKYLVSDTNGNVYQITDSLWYWTFDASNRYAKITPSQTYNVTLIGWRIPFISFYQNIIHIQD